MEKKIASVIRYFAIFGYFPKFEEVYTFFPIKISKNKLKKIYKAKKYTVGEYGIKRSKIKYQISKRKLANWRFRLFIRLLSIFPQIKLIGLSGSISMMNAEDGDDIDLFIITAKNRLFTGRFIAIVLALILGIKRNRDSARPIFITQKSHPAKRLGPLESEKIVRASFLKHKNKVCLNLFFDEGNLVVPKYKQTLFVGHEVLQMKPIINKSYTYEKFLSANRWVLSFFPNAFNNLEFRMKNSEFKLTILNFGWIIELMVKKFQLSLINKHKTSEIITSTQLWFHPDDFGKKIKL